MCPILAAPETLRNIRIRGRQKCAARTCRGTCSAWRRCAACRARSRHRRPPRATPGWPLPAQAPCRLLPGRRPLVREPLLPPWARRPARRPGVGARPRARRHPGRRAARAPVKGGPAYGTPDRTAQDLVNRQRWRSVVNMPSSGASHGSAVWELKER